MSTPITFSFAGLPADYCFTTPARLALDIVAGMSGYLPGSFTFIIDSESEPAAADRDKLWHKLLPGGAPTGQIYKYYLGFWVTPHQEAASGDKRTWFEGVEADVWSLDGGDGTDPSTNPPTATSGAMWEVDHNYDFRVPLGAGTSPAPHTTTVVPGDTGGEEEHTLTVGELPAHSHEVRYKPDAAGGGAGGYVAYNDNAVVDTNDTGSDESHNNMPPYRVGYWIKRTARQFLVA